MQFKTEENNRDLNSFNNIKSVTSAKAIQVNFNNSVKNNNIIELLFNTDTNTLTSKDNNSESKDCSDV